MELRRFEGDQSWWGGPLARVAHSPVEHVIVSGSS
jgi:hypothetical protein